MPTASCKGDDVPFMNWLRRMMYGRYGGDQLSFFLVGVYVVIYFLSYLPHMGFLSWLGLLVLVWSLYRSMSRQIDRRRAENARFMALAWQVWKGFPSCMVFKIQWACRRIPAEHRPQASKNRLPPR